MTVLIHCEKKTKKGAISIISKPDHFKRQIVSAWCGSPIKHCFYKESDFNETVDKNRKTLKSRDKIKFFTPENCFFATKANDRKETLYFIDWQKQTGRLRQEHKDGPLAKIDKHPRTHQFLSNERFEYVRKWRKKRTNKGRLPRFFDCETRPKVDRHHVEFARDDSKTSGWHESEGLVKTVWHNPTSDKDRKSLERKIASALRDILGVPVRSQKSRVIDKNAKLTA